MSLYSFVFLSFFKLPLIVVVADPGPSGALVPVGSLKLLAFHFMVHPKSFIDVPGSAAGGRHDQKHG